MFLLFIRYLPPNKLALKGDREIRKKNPQGQLPIAMKAKLVRQALVEKESGLFRSGHPENMAGSCLQNHLRIPGVLAGSHRGTVGRGGWRNFWRRAVSQLFSGFVTIFRLCPYVVPLLHPRFHCWCSGARRTSSVSVHSDTRCWACPVLTARVVLWSVTADVNKILIKKLLIHDFSMSLLAQSVL